MERYWRKGAKANAQATHIGDVFDDAATGQGLLNYFLRGMNCKAITEDEALVTGLTLNELRSRLFVKILIWTKNEFMSFRVRRVAK